MPESFGARLRERRERRQIDLATIAEQTKIKLSLLEALERDDVSHWPSGIFRRAFIRAYAHAIGLEPDVVVREFLERHPDPIEEVPTAGALAPGVEAASVSASPPTRFRYLVGSAIDAISVRLGSVQTHRSAIEDPATAVSAPVRGPAQQEPDVLPEVLPDVSNDAGPRTEPVAASAPPEPDLLAAAHLCTELGRVDEPRDALPLLQEATTLLDAVGLIVWVWDPLSAELRPALAHGYSQKVLAQLPRVRRDTNNATAAAFRSAQTCVVDGTDAANGALAVPLLTPTGCVGVLAIELQHGCAQQKSVRAVVTIFAAQLARLIGAAQPAEAADRRLA